MLALRPSSRDDDDDVLRVLAAREARDFGVADFIRGFLLERWREQRFRPEADAVVAQDGDVVVGYAGLFEQGALVFVDPGHERQGVGSRLREWAEALAEERRRSHHRQVIAHGNTGAHALLEAAGYQQVRSVIQMAKALEGAATAPAPPPGITLAPLDLPTDARALHLADTASFAGNADYQPSSFESFEQDHLQSPYLDTDLSRVARRGDAIAGFTLCRRQPEGSGYVDLLAVDPSERGRGLGTSLLLTAFADFARAGLRDAWLDVASDNPRGLRLYDRAGMSERLRVDVYEKPVRFIGTGARQTGLVAGG
ncbi:MAG: GNAT family N-acetyltransferase [Solirubrobacteraceae bacterium]